MLLEFCERCFAGTAPLVEPEWRWPSAPKVWRCDLRHRRCEGAKGCHATGALGLMVEGGPCGATWEHLATEAESWADSAPKAWREWWPLAPSRWCHDTWLQQTCKGGLAVRRHAGGLYDAGSYCYALVKRVKPFVRNGKGVIEVDDHTRGPPINSDPLVIERTHINEKRAPKALVCFLAFGFLNASFLFRSRSH
jgi:hypothetical protein